MTRSFMGGVAAIALSALLIPPAQAQSCQQVSFPAGFTSGAIEGQVSPDGVVCYALNMAPHNNNLGLSISGRNVMFGFNDGFNAMDAQTQTQLVPEGPTVRVTVSQLMRSATTEPFRLTVTFLPPGNG
ncbi:hypothetical protein [Flavimaricola marinus]|uniref:MSP domain-containing protein n=1 Tax=Flavimaricola marinus TaxID=1819565 RepID=A0A238LGM1_9RHOB|nr:hypothetical protein [Flavimaricola marinus]SMY08106.1 hypothetical protein LOM8899_02255 [Flavimaricola marinus]